MLCCVQLSVTQQGYVNIILPYNDKKQWFVKDNNHCYTVITVVYVLAYATGEGL